MSASSEDKGHKTLDVGEEVPSGKDEGGGAGPLRRRSRTASSVEAITSAGGTVGARTPRIAPVARSSRSGGGRWFLSFMIETPGSARTVAVVPARPHVPDTAGRRRGCPSPPVARPRHGS